MRIKVKMKKGPKIGTTKGDSEEAEVVLVVKKIGAEVEVDQKIRVDQILD